MKIGRELLKGHLPTLVLAILAEKPLHGYALCRELRERSRNALQVGEGTIYPLLFRLEEKGLLEAEWMNKQGGKPRKVYRVTSSGLRFLEEQKDEWGTLFRLAQDLMGKGWNPA